MQMADLNRKFQADWAIAEPLLRNVLRAVTFEHNAGFRLPTSELSQIYFVITQLSTVPTGGQELMRLLYNEFCNLLTSHLRGIGENLAEFARHSPGPELLRTIAVRYREFQAVKRWLLFNFDYVDRNFAKKPSDLNVTAMVIFKQQVFDHIKAPLREAILAQIEGERRGEVQDQGLVGPIIQIYVDVGISPDTSDRRALLEVYRQEFEKYFFVATRNFYRREAKEWTSRDTFSEYMEKAEQRLIQEETKICSFLPLESRRELMNTVETVLLRDEENRLIHMENSGFIVLLRNDLRNELSRLYRLFSRIDSPEKDKSGLYPIVELFRQFIVDTGNQLHATEDASSDKNSTEEYISKVLVMHHRFHSLVVDCFQNNHMFQRALKDAFEGFFNKPVQNVSTSELLASYFDRLLRSGKGKMDEGIATDAELDVQFERLVKVFGYLTEKDKFNEFYRKLLAKRLLMGRSESEDSERAVIAKLKFAHGASFTSKLEGMINDINLSAQRQADFHNYCVGKENKTGGVVMDVHVLQMNHWPTYKPDTLALPIIFQNLVNVFQDYYNSRNSSRRLQWVHSLGSVTLKANFQGKQYELSLSTYQAVVLICFNTKPRFTISELATVLNMPIDEAKRSIAALALGKYKILIKASAAAGGEAGPSASSSSSAAAASSSMGGGNSGSGGGDSAPGGSGGLRDDDVIVVNDSFSDKMVRIKIPNVNTKLSSEEVKAAQNTVDNDRQYMIDAAIVRIMKSRKVLSHTHLIAEAMLHLQRHFVPQPMLLKRRIEDLISRDYLKRSVQDRNSYEYVA